MKSERHFTKIGNVKKYLVECNLKINISDFDFTLDERMKTLREIWKVHVLPKEQKEQNQINASETVVGTTDKKFPYMEINLNETEENVFKNIIEGVHLPSKDTQIEIFNAKLPKDWEKYVACTKGGPTIGKTFYTSHNQIEIISSFTIYYFCRKMVCVPISSSFKKEILHQR